MGLARVDSGAFLAGGMVLASFWHWRGSCRWCDSCISFKSGVGLAIGIGLAEGVGGGVVLADVKNPWQVWEVLW